MKKHLLKIQGSLTFASVEQKKTHMKFRKDNIAAMVAVILAENNLTISGKSKPVRKIIGQTSCRYCGAMLDYIISKDKTVSFKCSTSGCMSLNI